MEILGYGEDALTLWSLKNRLDFILASLGDSSDISKCRAFFRPSFGRSGGNKSSQFGEFDFILLTEQYIYLGESKWDKSSEKIVNGLMDLRREQLLRHRLFKFYIEKWAYGNYTDWGKFESLGNELGNHDFTKPTAPSSSLLAKNLQTVLRIIRDHYPGKPEIRNVLLYFYDSDHGGQPLSKAGDNFEVVFEVVNVDYSKDNFDHYIKL